MRATVVFAVCCVYCVVWDGLSMERRKTDLFEAYAMRSPFESAERGVGWPRRVDGRAAKMPSIVSC